MKGIDISTHQKEVDYNKLKKQGYEFAILRCGYGRELSQKDAMFDKHYEGCKKAGLLVGAYLYSYVTSLENSIKEAYNCIEFLKGKTFDLPIFYDLEDKITVPLGMITITECANNFCEILHKSGYDVGIYANSHWLNNYINISKLPTYCYIWLAQWDNIEPKKTYKYHIWQYTSKRKS